MAESEVRYYILRTRALPVQADSYRVESSWPDARGFPGNSVEVAPGVRVKFLSYGDHWQPAPGDTIHGALIAVQVKG